MALQAFERLRRTPQWLRKRFAPGGLILLYHRVAEVPLDPHELCVPPPRFAEHLEVLRKYSRPMSLRQLTQTLRDGGRPDRAAVVTFDDGYADSLHHAKPLLERYDVPATVFITTGQNGRASEFWWDELQRLLLLPGTLPETLTLNVGGKAHRFELGAAANYSEDEFERQRDWNHMNSGDYTPRHRLYRALHKLLRPLPPDERQTALDELLAWAGAELACRPTHRALSPEEVARLADGGLVEVGAHTVNHPVLASLPVAAQRDEIRQSKTRLEEILGSAVNSFAYPYGARTDYTAETVSAVREAGFDSACTTTRGVIGRHADLFQLPRLSVGDWGVETFEDTVRWLAFG